MTQAARDPLDVALRQLRSIGLLVDRINIGPPARGKVWRVDVEGQRKGKKSGWYMCDWFRLDNGQQVVVGSYGIWVGDDPGTINLDFEVDAAVSAAERERVRAEQQRMAAVQAEHLDEQRADAAKRAGEIWPKLPDHGAVPYLQRKQVRMFGCRIGRDGALVVPLRRPFSDALVGLQFIQPDGTKRFITGTAKHGAAHLIGDLPEDESATIGLAEGYATGATGHQATTSPTFVCFDCGNLLAVARAIREARPRARLVVFADHDQWTVRGAIRKTELAGVDVSAIAGDDAQWADWRARGWLVNAGLDAAYEVLEQCTASIALPPIAADDPAKRTDWNDLHVSEGIDRVRAAILTPGSLITSRPAAEADDIGPAPMGSDEDGDDDGVDDGGPMDGDAQDAPAPAAVALTHEQLLAGYELIHGTTDVWDVDAGKPMKFAAFKALFGSAAAKAWQDDTAKRVRIGTPAKPKVDKPPHKGLKLLEWERGLVFGDAGLKPSTWNVMHVLRNHDGWKGVFGFDAFAKRIVKLKPTPFESPAGLLTDTDEVQVAAWFGRRDTYRASIKTPIATEAISVVSSDNTFHPVRDYLGGLTWDGVDRLDDFFSDFCNVPKSATVSGFARNFFIQAVARIYRPGVKADLMLVLEGGQGARKSTLAATLAGVGNYADVGTAPSDKDFYQIIQGVWLVEISEMASFARAENSHIKRAISVAVDRFRRSYGRNVEEFKRECVFFGTANNSDWQKDETGGRRYMPVWVGDVDIDGVLSVRDQLWAEAVHRFNAGEPWWILPEGAEDAQEERYVEDVWAEPVLHYLQGKPGTTGQLGVGPRKKVTISELLTYALDMDVKKQDRSAQTRMGNLMRRLGWTARQRRVGGGVTKIREYFPPEKEA
ncbi:VapE domain-containing protein [Nevskia sp.]|uniref:VapE domain-containing protein n=1 Tax=Nevskia sp. TaxID=1929292 RepID=UPI0025DEAD85|nr:VapE domain-containing protein [Nevskia sp.]